MKRSILYYPKINIPSSTWLRNALMYWDEVCSIVPRTFSGREDEFLSTDIRYLIDEGQYRSIDPESLLSSPNSYEFLNDFVDEFKEIILNERFLRVVNRLSKPVTYNIHQDKLRIGEQSRIHASKTTYQIYDFLAERGLANRQEDPEWLSFENNTGLIYMSLLAKYLADINPEQMTIGTDANAYETLNFRRVAKKEGFPAIRVALNNILPTPAENVPLEKIIDFKRRRIDNLKSFRLLLSEFNSKISSSTSLSELKEISFNFQDTISLGVRDISDVLADSNISHVGKSLTSLINIRSPTTLLAAAGGLSKAGLLMLPFDVTGFGLATVATLQIGYSHIENRNQRRAAIRNSPFSYLYYARKYGLTS
ncbi:DUF6236 family protein [Parapedobacter lycopersici]|uniref:DUF6236 family protein n=1 Tax=Parapedobacter lycopersici TaxID=1864939 RepID=UPI00214DD554|nr:DUF6236 family protein [Parapedobacter lycopersici]